MPILAKKFLVSSVFVAIALTAACQIENLPVNSNNSNVNLSESPKKSPAPNSNAAANNNAAIQPSPIQPSPTVPPQANTAFPPYNSSAANTNPEIIAVSKLIVPVAGIKKEDLRDTFTDARSEGRVHNALDIMAAGGTPVLAATDGKLVKFHDSVLGGITIYEISSDDPRLVLYYAHLQRRADGIAENTDVKKGTVIGYVGDTGNAGAGNYHLHFAMWVVDDPKHYWAGANVNPYQYLK